MKLKSLLASLLLSATVPAVVNAQTDDVGVNTIISPNINGNICTGYNDLIVKVSNYGTNMVSSFNLTWSLDNIVQGTRNVSSNLNTYNQPNSTININLGMFYLPYNTPTQLKVWTSDPNGNPDSRKTNDTFTIVLDATDPGIQLNELNDTFMCYNSSLILDAGYSAYTDYTWSNGTQAQLNTITQPGRYWIWAYNNQGCQAFDTFTVTEIGEPAITNLGITDLGDLKFNFMLSNPVNVTDVTWNFGDGSPVETGTGNKTHTYANEGDYTVEITLENECGQVVISQVIHVQNITSIKNVKDLVNAINFYPNPATSYLNITYPKNLVEVYSVSLVNTTGQTVLFSESATDLIDVSDIASGLYNVVLHTSKGIASKKVEILH